MPNVSDCMIYRFYVPSKHKLTKICCHNEGVITRSPAFDITPTVGDTTPTVGDITPTVGDITPTVGDITPPPLSVFVVDTTLAARVDHWADNLAFLGNHPKPCSVNATLEQASTKTIVFV